MASKKTSKKAPAPPVSVVTADRRPMLWLYAGLILITLAIYLPAWHGTPLWDDDAHLTRVDLQPLAGLWRIWFDLGATQQYYPATHSAFWIMHALWGDHTLGYHLVNIVLHATSAWLLIVILRRLAVPGAVLAGLIFAVHPVQVESVAWMTELKNTLSGVLYLSAALAYLRFDRTRQPKRYAIALVLFALALLSKSVTASLPAALLVVFWWQRGQLSWRRDVSPLAPFFALGLAAGLLTSWVERTQIGAEGAAFQFSLLERSVIAGRAVWFYLGKLFWPADLMFVYPRWTISASPAWLLFPLAAVAMLFALWFIRARTRAPLAAMLFFVGTLVPALGFVNVYPFVYSFVADHFQYLASIGVIVLVASGLMVAARRWLTDERALVVIGLVIAVPLASVSYRQSRQYADAEALYRATIAANPAAWLAHVNLGWVYLGQQRAEPAIAETREALRLKPDLLQAQNNLGTALLDLGRFDEAVAAYRDALRLKPDAPDVRRNLAIALERLADAEQDHGDIAAAVETYKESIDLNPDSPEAHHNLGSAYARLGRLNDAISQYEAALRINPGAARAVKNLARAHNSRGIELADARKFAEAVAEFSEAVRLDPDDIDAAANLARARAMIK
jgi:tetratricopeptide (TPR) repeat protein